MRHWSYAAILLACLIGTAPLEFLLHTRVYARWRRLLLTIAPVFVVFVAWDLWAIHVGAWWYDPARTLGVRLPGRIPLEEIAFFVVIPVCSILTLEAVRARKPHWVVGDE